MKARIVELPSHKSSPPHCCIVTGRTDGPVVDFGDPTPKACGPRIDPRVQIRVVTIEDAATRLLGMVPRAEAEDLREQLASVEAERERLAAIVGAGEDITTGEARLREALGPAPELEGP